MLRRIEAAHAPEIQPSVVRPLRTQETSHQRFRRALALETRIEAGEVVETAEAVWLGGYQLGAEYRALKRLHQEFGDEALR
jgi:hypothetical protein